MPIIHEIEVPYFLTLSGEEPSLYETQTDKPGAEEQKRAGDGHGCGAAYRVAAETRDADWLDRGVVMSVLCICLYQVRRGKHPKHL